MHQLAVSLTEYLINQEITTNDRKEEYIYGFEMFGLKCINHGTIILMAYLSGFLVPTIFFMICFLSLRGRTGGYHAKTSLQCYFASIGIYIFTSNIASPLLLHNTYVASIVLIMSITVIFILAPLNHINLELDKKELEDNKKASRILVILIAACISVASLLRISPVCIRFAISGVVLDAGLLVIQNMKEGREQQ